MEVGVQVFDRGARKTVTLVVVPGHGNPRGLNILIYYIIKTYMVHWPR